MFTKQKPAYQSNSFPKYSLKISEIFKIAANHGQRNLPGLPGGLLQLPERLHQPPVDGLSVLLPRVEANRLQLRLLVSIFN